LIDDDPHLTTQLQCTNNDDDEPEVLGVQPPQLPVRASDFDFFIIHFSQLSIPGSIFF
jgi:hypothetical protein